MVAHASKAIGLWGAGEGLKCYPYIRLFLALWICDVKTVFTTLLHCYLSVHCVDICADCVYPMGNKTASVKTVQLKCTNSTVFFKNYLYEFA